MGYKPLVLVLFIQWTQVLSQKGTCVEGKTHGSSIVGVTLAKYIVNSLGLQLCETFVQKAPHNMLQFYPASFSLQQHINGVDTLNMSKIYDQFQSLTPDRNGVDEF